MSPREIETLKCFQQMLTEPRGILVTLQDRLTRAEAGKHPNDDNVRVADFGMAALHPGPDYELCGSRQLTGGAIRSHLRTSTS